MLGLHFKFGESVNSSNGVMMRYVNVLSAWFAFQVWRKCKFFQWRDDEICERGKVLIP